MENWVLVCPWVGNSGDLTVIRAKACVPAEESVAFAWKFQVTDLLVATPEQILSFNMQHAQGQLMAAQSGLIQGYVFERLL